MNAHANLDPSKILGAVIDPKTGRYCALQIDIAKSLGIPPSAVAFCKPRIHQTRFADILDVIEARAKTPRRGRPKDSDRQVAA
jgi:hypothetical protein